jgi:hypothetical protein
MLHWPDEHCSGESADMLDLKLYEWPDTAFPEGGEYQFVEQEYMKEEYQDLIDDPRPSF